MDADDLPNVGRTAKVNSPKDGFLALRNLPSHDIGDRIAKIPHGETINVLLCSEQSVTIAGRTGHWCMVSHNNQTGWVFDVWPFEIQRTKKEDLNGCGLFGKPHPVGMLGWI